MSPPPLRVLYESRELLAVDKPAGLLAVAGRGEAQRRCVLSELLAQGAREARVVHRLDQDTSGVMVVALSAAAQRALAGQFERRQVRKRYIAWVAGRLLAQGGHLVLPSRLDVDHRPHQIVDPLHGRAASTSWQRLGESGERTRLALFPHTGRTHQLRLAAAHPWGLGRPILGDRLYGPAAAAPRLMLHAEELLLREPGSGQMLRLCAPAPF